MATGLGILGVSGKTPFAYIGQRGLTLFADHPMLEVRALIADDPEDVGKTLAEAVEGRWLLDDPVPSAFADRTLVGLDERALRDAGVELILSGLPGPHARELDPQLAAMGFPVVSESAGLRLEPDVPLIVPDINADHLGLVPAQKRARGWDGFIVSCPVCTAVVVGISMKPLVDTFGLEGSVITTMQALSGAGPTGVPGLGVVDNVLPFIPDEEEKLRNELAKILGTLDGDEIRPHPAPISTTCTRIGVRDGHTASVSLALESELDLERATEALASYRGRAQELGLPSAPKVPIVVRPEQNRPQPILDRDVDHGRVVSVGRLRAHEALKHGIGYVAVGHNHDRGTVGNAAIVCELVVAEGLVGSGA